MTRLRWLGCLLVAGLLGCGGKAVVDGMPGEGGGGSSTTSTTTGSPTGTPSGLTSSTSTGDGCVQHGQCETGLCIFSTGVCSTSCTPTEPCGTGSRCDSCATSSCPECYDCVSACVPAELGTCDDHDDCPSDERCVYWSQLCAPQCLDNYTCEDPNLYCDTCATSSCPMCAVCWSACVGYWEE